MISGFPSPSMSAMAGDRASARGGRNPDLLHNSFDVPSLNTCIAVMRDSSLGVPAPVYSANTITGCPVPSRSPIAGVLAYGTRRVVPGDVRPVLMIAFRYKFL